MLPHMMVVTKLDKEHSDIGLALDSAHNVFKRAIVPFLPIGKEHNFKGVVDVVHMKAYGSTHGKAKRSRSRRTP
jgi:elongation factor G